MKTFVIAAATGNIGSKLVKELRDRGHRVIEVSRDTNKAAPLKALSAEIAVGQILDLLGKGDANRRRSDGRQRIPHQDILGSRRRVRSDST